MSTHYRIKNLMNKYNRFKNAKGIIQICVKYPIITKINKFVEEVLQSILLMEEFVRQE